MSIIEEHRDKKGDLHRPVELGPARIWSICIQFYYEHGKCHRPHELGPTIIGLNGYQEYWKHGIEKTLKEFQAIYKIQKWFKWQKIYE
jgi:hypothetical protein